MTQPRYELVPFPADFPNKGEFVAWDTKTWDRTGYSDMPRYPGQMPVTFPEDATLLEIQVGGYLRELSSGTRCEVGV